jgi:hypothetical protein
MIDDLQSRIESPQVIVDVMLASTPEALRRRLEDNSALGEVFNEIIVNPSLFSALTARAESLYEEVGQPGYLSEADQPLAAYLFLLGRAEFAGARHLMERVANSQRADLRAARWIAAAFQTTESRRPLAEVA